jgi:FKBP-type peptidyl-prolyl cis-trans isomerase (trigger factor)
MIKSSYKKLDNGNLEIVFTISGDTVIETTQKVLKEIAKDVTVAGFRKGKAPIDKVKEVTNDEKLTEHVLSHLLPESFAKVCEENHLRPAMYPKYEAVKITSAKNIATNGEWEVRATTCEIPEINLPKDYKKKLKNDPKDANVLIKSLLGVVNVQVPQILIDEEVNIKLSQVLERIEKLGLTLDGYLKSVGKNVEQLRKEYTDQAVSSISLELILNKIAEDEKIEVLDSEIDDLIKATGEDKTKVDKQKRDLLKRVILRKKALEKITPK